MNGGARGGPPLSGVVAGHYRIERLLGAGGMGAVYRATDTRLRRSVAIKALLPELTAEPRSLERFRREARMACRVSHPYVAAVHDVAEHDGQLLIVMEYLEGRTLSAVLRDWQPSRESVLRWLLEIAEALSEIHRGGIVHRDIKPGNVMITEAGHAKLTDFGLARPHLNTTPEALTATAETELTASGAAVGTPLYMSPEQLRGEQADPRSDQFAFGVLMYETLTGVHPFSRASVAESLSAILESPPTGGESSPLWTASAELRAIVNRTLEKRPAARFENSELLLEALTTAIRHLTAPPQRRSRVAMVSGIALLAALLGGLGLRAWLLQPPVWERDRYVIAIAPFAATLGDEPTRLEAALLTDLLTQDLQASRLIRAEGPDQLSLAGINPLLTLRDLGVKTASARDVDYVMIGSLSPDGPRWRARVETRASREGMRELAPIEAVGTGALDLAETVAAAVRRRLPDISRLTAMRDDRVDLERLTSSSEEARHAYERGAMAMREGRLVKAIEELERATSLDSRFTLAHARLADALDRIGDSKSARGAADAARESLRPGQGPSEERLALIVEALRARILGNRDSWIQASERLVERFPDEPALLAQHAEALRGVQQFGESLATVDRAIQLDARNPGLRLLRARALIDLERYDEADAALDESEAVYRLLDSREGIARVDTMRGEIHRSREDIDAAVAAYTRAAEAFAAADRPITEAETWLAAQVALLFRGDFQQAGERIDDAERVARAAGNHRLLSQALVARAVLHYYQRDWDGAIDFYGQAVDEARLVENTALKLPPLGNMASLLVWLRRADEALPLLEEFEAGAAELGMREARDATLINRAEVAHQLGDMAGAIDAYETLLASSGDTPGQMSLLGHMGLASLHRERGRYAAALEHLEMAVEQARALERPSTLGRALSNLARVKSLLGRDAAAERDMEEAAVLAADYPDLTVALAKMRASLAFDRGHWREALERATADPAEAHILGQLIACAAATRNGEPRRAIRFCEAILADPTATPPDRAEAESWLGLAHLDAGDPAGALAAARSAFDAAEQLDLLLPRARAGAVVVRLPDDARPPDASSLVEGGREALDTLTESAPTEDRETFGERPDLRILREELG